MSAALNRRRFLANLGAALAGPAAKGTARQETPSAPPVAPVQEQHAPPVAPKPATPKPLTINIDARHGVGPLDHYWESIVGSGRASLAFRADYQKDLKQVHDAAGMQAVRFHGIFDDDDGVCWLDSRGDVVYNFQYVDQIYDSLLDAGVRPFVELSFMPAALASGNKTVFWYKGNVTPPKDMDAWVAMITAFARHLFTRYGGGEISHWFFEVWNEPNLDFWAGTQDQYFELYRRTALALKAVDKRVRVGGPASAEAAWAPDFIKYCSQHNAPVDFFSTHIYANDPQQKVFGPQGHYALEDVIPLALQKVRNAIASSPMPHTPIFITEWNSTYMNVSAVTDSCFNAAFIVHTLDRCRGLVDAMSYWCFSDVFEEQGVPKNIFYGGFGLIAIRRIPKPSLHAFTLLHRLGNGRLQAGEGPVLATARADGSVAIIAWNLVSRDEHGTPASGEPIELRLVVRGLQHRKNLSVTRVDDEHGSVLPAYQKMGSPRYPTETQIEALRKAGALPAPETSLVAGGEYTNVPLTLPPNGIALLEFKG
ncbi:MAG: GH39 family glycosyl hydrolase [Terriglobia bacterium]